MKFKATVLHNVGPDMFMRLSEGTNLFHAHDLLIEADSPLQAAELVFEITNLEPEDVSAGKALMYGNQMREYRKRMNRSTSVGDVLILRDAHAEDDSLVAVLYCAMVGWEPLNVLPSYEGGDNSTEESASYHAHQDFRRSLA